MEGSSTYYLYAHLVQIFCLFARRNERRDVSDLGKAAKAPPLVGSKSTFCKDVANLFFGADVPKENARICADPFEQPVQVNAVSARDVPHERGSTFYAHLYHGIVVFEYDYATVARG